jgi:hypothetical protein
MSKEVSEIFTDKKKSSVHDGGSVEHGRHENVVTGAVDKGHVSDKTKLTTTAGTFTRKYIIFT